MSNSNNNLFRAHREWRDRPADERYPTLKALYEAVHARREASVASVVDPTTLRAEAVGIGSSSKELAILGPSDQPAIPTHWAFSQLCSYSDAPGAWLRRLPADMAAFNLSWALQHSPRQQLEMVWANGSAPATIRCFNTPMYARMWDEVLVQWLRRATDDEQNGWHRPPAKTDGEYPSGYYAGDRNIFCFCVNDQNRIDDGKQGLGRGFFCWNSEVRQMGFGFEAFLYEFVCGNHIVWGAHKLFSLRMSHLGEMFIEKAASKLKRALGLYLNAGAATEQKLINQARKQTIAADKQGVIDLLSSRRIGFNLRESDAIVTQAEQDGDDPTVLWSVVNGATALSQQRFAHTDERTAWDRKAGKLLDLVAF